MIKDITKIFGLDETQFKKIKEARKGSDKLNPYVVLGVKPENDLLFIRNKYIELSKEYHPNLLINKKISKEAIEENKQRFNEIISAWKRIQKLKS